MVAKNNNSKSSKSQSLSRKERAEVNNIVKQQLAENIESKYKKTTTELTGVGTTASIINLCNIPIGTTDITRIGDRIDLSVLRTKLFFESKAESDTFRVVIFQWHVDNTQDTMSTSTDLQGVLSAFQSGTGTSANAVANLLDMYYVDNLKGGKFTIIHDKLYTVSTEDPVKHVELKYNLYKDRKTKKSVHYKGGSPASGYNLIYMAVFSDSTIAPNPEFAQQSIVTFKDA